MPAWAPNFTLRLPSVEAAAAAPSVDTIVKAVDVLRRVAVALAACRCRSSAISFSESSAIADAGLRPNVSGSG